MNRVISAVPAGEEGEVRHCVRLESDPCDGPKTPDGRRQIFTLFQQLSGLPELLLCGTSTFERMMVWHDGFKWVIEANAVERPD